AVADERHAEQLGAAGQVIAFRPGPLDEGDGDPVLAGCDLHRNVRQSRDEGLTALRAIAIGEREVLESADMPARDLFVVHEKYDGRLSLHAVRIQTRIDAVAVDEVEVIL